MKKLVAFFIIVQCVLQSCVAQVATTDRLPIDPLQIEKHIRFLASDELAGRKAGSEGEKKAAGYILSQLQSICCELL